MKSLNDTIMESKIRSELDGFDRQVLSHITLDLYENSVYYKTRLVLEKYGIYEGLKELVYLINKDIQKRLKEENYIELHYKNSDFSDFLPNVFFENLYIRVDYGVGDGGEYLDSISKLNDNMLVESVYINLYPDFKNNVMPLLYHELTHAYNHWKMMVENPDGIADMIDNDFYSKLMPDQLMTPVDEFVRKTLYFTTNIEQNAFVGTIAGELRKKFGPRKIKVSSPLDALKYIKETDVYMAYKSIVYSINSYKAGKLSDELAQEVADEYNRISNTHLTPNKVFKKLEALINKSMKKIDNQIGKLCLDLFENPSATIPSKTYLK